MRKSFALATMIALFAGSLASASALTGALAPGLLTGESDRGEMPDTTSAAPTAEPDAEDHGRSADNSRPEDAPGPAATPAALDTPAADHLPENDHARGLVFDGLRLGAQNGPCQGGYEIPLPNGTELCSHGPDESPPGLDVRAKRSVADLVRATPGVAEDAAEDGGGVAAEAGAVPCIGDGVSGNRVQAVYAVAADRTDRFAEVEPLIAQWAGSAEDVFSQSAAQVGGERHVRFVTDAGCGLAVDRVVLSPSGDDTITNTINELAALGYDRNDRKYLVWMDAAVYCGIAQIYNDDRGGQENLSNVRSGYARVDQGCWGRTYSTEAHELVHSLGGVQPSAPHASANFHCTDEEDRMCYKDGADVVLTYDCPVENAAYLDCNHDDYYHPDPPPGSYLDTHWNVADSSFLHAGPVGDPPPPPPPPVNTAPTVSAAAPTSVMLGDGAALDGTVSDDGLPGPYTVAWSQASGPGSATFAAATVEDTTASFSVPGVYVLTLGADDGELAGADSVTITVEEEVVPPPPPQPTSTTEVFEGSLNRKWPARIFETTVADGPAEAALTFSSGRGKKAARTELTLNVYDASGTLVSTATGPNPVELTATLGAGTYTWEVTGAKASFSLEVTYMML